MKTPVYKTREFMRRLKHAGKDVQIFNWALILKPEVIEIDDGARIDDYARIEGGSGIKIGKFVHIGSFAGILAGGKAVLGDFSGIAQGARIITGSGYPFEEFAPVIVPSSDPAGRKQGRVVMGRFSFVGANAVVLPNVTLGEGAMIGAGSVVRKDVPPWTVVSGNPARVVGKREVLKPKPEKGA